MRFEELGYGLKKIKDKSQKTKKKRRA